MNDGHRQALPEWAARERLHDLAWIAENLDAFGQAAEELSSERGRGAIVVDTRVRPCGDGHPFTYYTQTEVTATQDHEAQRLAREYDPETEMGIVLLKQKGRVSVYRCRLA